MVHIYIRIQFTVLWNINKLSPFPPTCLLKQLFNSVSSASGEGCSPKERNLYGFVSRSLNPVERLYQVSKLKEYFSWIADKEEKRFGVHAEGARSEEPCRQDSLPQGTPSLIKAQKLAAFQVFPALRAKGGPT